MTVKVAINGFGRIGRNILRRSRRSRRQNSQRGQAAIKPCSHRAHGNHPGNSLI